MKLILDARTLPTVTNKLTYISMLRLETLLHWVDAYGHIYNPYADKRGYEKFVSLHKIAKKYMEQFLEPPMFFLKPNSAIKLDIPEFLGISESEYAFISNGLMNMNVFELKSNINRLIQQKKSNPGYSFLKHTWVRMTAILQY